MQTILKSYSDESTDFLDKVIPKIGSQYICLAVILIDLSSKKLKVIICKYFLKNKNTLDILLTTQKFLLMILQNRLKLNITVMSF